MTDQKMIARVEYEGCAFSIKSQLGTKQKGAFIEGVHLWRVHLWRVDCNYERRDTKATKSLDKITKNIVVPSQNGKNIASNLQL